MADTSWECTGARLDRLITQTAAAARRRLRRRRGQSVHVYRQSSFSSNENKCTTYYDILDNCCNRNGLGLYDGRLVYAHFSSLLIPLHFVYRAFFNTVDQQIMYFCS